MDLLQELARDKGFSIIIVTHNLGLVARYADRIYVMYGGNIVESGDKFTLFENPIHPYTRGLLDAIPRLDDSKDRRLTPIEGNPPPARSIANLTASSMTAAVTARIAAPVVPRRLPSTSRGIRCAAC